MPASIRIRAKESKVGEGVPESRLGETVVALSFFGGYSEQVCVPATQAFPLPDGVSLEAAAA